MTTYELRYRSRTPNGEKREHALHLESQQEFYGAIKACRKLGNKLVINQMCIGCDQLGKECGGEPNHACTTCDIRKVS